jgi:hypothetical protein
VNIAGIFSDKRILVLEASIQLSSRGGHSAAFVFTKGRKLPDATEHAAPRSPSAAGEQPRKDWWGGLEQKTDRMLGWGCSKNSAKPPKFAPKSL